MELGELFHKWGDLRLEGYIQGKQVIVKRYSGKGIDQKFTLLPDDTSLVADGADTTRVVLRVTDEFDAIRPFANDAIKFELEGPGGAYWGQSVFVDRRDGSDLDSNQRAGRNRAADGDASSVRKAAGRVHDFRSASGNGLAIALGELPQPRSFAPPDGRGRPSLRGSWLHLMA